MTNFKVSKYFCFVSALMLFLSLNGQALANGIQEAQKGTIKVSCERPKRQHCVSMEARTTTYCFERFRL